ncbi:MAG: hypothetical protein ACLTW9_23410 [Enterocloster sp.]
MLRQLNTLSGIELKEVETGDAVSGLAKGDITAYVCGETEAREFMAAGRHPDSGTAWPLAGNLYLLYG